MGAYENVAQPNDDSYEGDERLWVKPADFAAAFPVFEVINPGDGKVTRHYCFEDVFEESVTGKRPTTIRHFRVYDFKQTSAYDSGLPDVDAFWSSQEYVCLHVEMNGHAKRDSMSMWDFTRWIYMAINHIVIKPES